MIIRRPFQLQRKIQTFLFFVPSLAFAATDYTEPQQILGRIIVLGTQMGQLLMAIAVLVILYAAFQYMTAGGNEDKVSDATKTLTYAIIGIVVSLLAFSIPPIVKSLIG